MKVKLISLVIPCYNEADTVGEFYRRARKMAEERIENRRHRPEGRRFEFIFVNDCSTDETGPILNALAKQDKRVKVLHFAHNRGHQIALTAGTDYALGDMIVTIDADLQDPPELIYEMLEKIEEGYDVVHAQRRDRKGETWFKLLTARIFYRLMKRLSDTPVIENCGDYRAFTRPVQETIAAFRTSHRYLRGTFVQVGFRQCVLQYDRDARYAGETKYPFLKMMNLSVDAILGFSAAPIRVITFLSVILWSISLVYVIKSLIEHFILKITVQGWTSIIVLMFFFTGLILFSIAIIGSYVGRIFMQGQNPPLYWLCDTRNVDAEQILANAGELREIKLSQRIIRKQEENRT
ncbi:MAG: glycosyltransferase [Deltaproteobacteria bacterium]|nr:MAG: glycosyltransferase [Deltaproteobacteria bacterium]